MTLNDFTNRYHYNPVEDKLGAGGFGAVFKAYDTLLDKEVAIKIATVIPGKEKRSLMKEVELANGLPSHPNLVRYERCFRLAFPDGQKDVGILQYYPEGSLAHLIKKGSLNDDQKYYLILAILDGLAFLHQHHILHRDLKPGNILIAKRGNQYVPKIADFGLSRQVESFEQSSFVNSFVGGSAYYAAPEQLAGDKVRANVDLWSFGVLLYELMTGNRPFTATASRGKTEDARQEIYRKIKGGTIPPQIQTIAEPYQTMIKACLIPDRTKRVQKAIYLVDIMEGDHPIHFDYDQTSIDDTVTAPLKDKRGSKTTSQKTFTSSSSKRVKDKQQKTRQSQTKSQKKKKKPKLLPLLFIGLAIVGIKIAYPIWGNKVQPGIAALEQNDEDRIEAMIDSIRALSVAESSTRALAEAQTKSQSETDAWVQAKSAHTIDAYESFIGQYPLGTFKGKAYAALANLELKLETNANMSADSFTDSRDGQTYTYKQMNDGKKWMTQNLNYNTSGSFCYEDKNSNCQNFGRLYTWAAAKSACPEGWHLPSDQEWQDMAKKYGGAVEDFDYRTNKGKAAYQSLIASGSSGFFARLGGLYHGGSIDLGYSSDLGYSGSYWTSTASSLWNIITQQGADNAWSYDFEREYTGLRRVKRNKNWAVSCRCIKD